MVDPTLVERLKKLLALAKSPNSHEAGAALAKAQELMAKHQLTISDLERQEIGATSVRSTQSVSRPKDWEATLVVAVAQAFGCRVLWNPSHSKAKEVWGRFELVGPKHQLPVVEHFTVYLLRTLTRERARVAKMLKGLQLSRAVTTQELDGFCHGWVKVIRSKLHALTQDEATTRAVEEYLQKHAAGATTTQRRQAGALGYGLGQEAADKVQLHRPMSGQTPVPQLGDNDS